MTKSLPQRTKKYCSRTSVSEIWERFKQRASDVFVCTPPKSGTTWMQTICGMLIFDNPAVNPGNGTTTRWLDSAFNDQDVLLAELEAQAHRRYIKTHTPLDGITDDENCTYLAVYRHPIDAFFSGLNHTKNMKKESTSRLLTLDVNDGFQTWLHQSHSLSEDIGNSLESLVIHYQSFASWSSLPNIHVFHYSGMTRDLRRTVSTVSEALNCGHSDALLDAITSAATFSNMKSDAAKYAPSADCGIWKDNAEFFESGTSNKWEGVLSDTRLSMYRDRMSGLLEPRDQAWLEFGS